MTAGHRPIIALLLEGSRRSCLASEFANRREKQ
jgi:hypothetical protein